MATYTEKQEYKVEVIPPYKIIQVRRSDITLKDNVEVGRNYYRYSLSPSDDVSSEPADVKTVADALWTTDVINTYKTYVASLESG